MAKTMKAVVFHGTLDVKVEDRPVPEIVDQTDAIIKVSYSALCGSELHVFRGHQPSATGFVMGHESVGEGTLDSFQFFNLLQAQSSTAKAAN